MLNDLEMEINNKILAEKYDKEPFIRLILEPLQNSSLYWTELLGEKKEWKYLLEQVQHSAETG